MILFRVQRSHWHCDRLVQHKIGRTEGEFHRREFMTEVKQQQQFWARDLEWGLQRPPPTPSGATAKNVLTFAKTKKPFTPQKIVRTHKLYKS